MDLSSFSTLSMENQRQSIEDLIIEEKREVIQEHVDRAQAAAEGHATVTCAQEEAVRKENTQAQDEESRSSDNSPRADPVQGSKSVLQQKATSNRQTGAFRVSHSSFRPAPFDGCLSRRR